METRAEVQPPPFAGTSVKVIIGGFLVALGVLLTLDNLNLLETERYLDWWPVVLVAVGVAKFIGGSNIAGTVLVVLGSWMTAENVGLVRFTLFDLWPLALIGGGVIVVARAIGFMPRKSDEKPASSNTWGVLGVRKIVETSRDFGGKRYVALLGGCEIDLTAAEIAQSPAVIETFAFWAGIEITVPDHWEIVGEVVPVMGGFEVKVRTIAAPQKQLIVRGMAIMAGVEIRSARGRAS